MSVIDPESYQDFVMHMLSDVSKETFAAQINTAALGLGGESGEVIDIVKKLLFHGMPFTDAIKAKLKDEAGDCLFYLAVLAAAIDEDFLTIMQGNVDKLTARYPSGTFSVADFLRKENAKSA